MTSPALTLVLADDHTLFREGLAELISADADLQVVAHAATGYEAVERAEEWRPDILLLDVRLPGPGADRVIECTRASSAGTQVVILTMYDEPVLSERLRRAGAAEYLVKNISHQELVSTLRKIGAWCSGHPAADLPTEAGDHSGSGLSGREIEVLRLVAHGHANARIAAMLGIAEATVKRHLTNVYAKLGATSRVDALRRAYAAGLLPFPTGPSRPEDDIPETKTG